MSNIAEITLFGDDRLYVTKARAEVGGDKWYIIQGDPDPRPSNPHAHHAHDKRNKLDLSNGDIYIGKTKAKRISKKLLHKVRAEFEALVVKNEDKYGWVIMPELTL